MRSIRENLLVMVLTVSISGVAMASENETGKLSSDLLKNQVDKELRLHVEQNISQRVNDHLDHNVKKHRDSGRYYLILVNDKISDNYTTLNYKINKQFRYGTISSLGDAEK